MKPHLSEHSPEKTIRRSPQGFTLVELLVVIAVLAILAALVMPAYNSVIRRADASKALSQIRIVAQCILAFSADNGGRLPEAFSWPVREKIYLKPDWVTGTIGEDWPDDMWVWALVNTQNLPLETFTNPRANKQLQAISLGPKLAYMLNQVPSMLESADNKAYFTSPARFARPARTILLSEFAFNEETKGNIPWSYCNYWPNWGLHHACLNEKMGIKKSHYAFMDGHVETLSPSETVGSDATGDKNTTRWMDPSMFPNNFFTDEAAFATYLRGLYLN